MNIAASDAELRYQFPRPLYRYQMVSNDLERERQLFLDSQLFFETPRRFNDPFDSKPHIAFSNQGKVTIDWANQLVKGRYPHLNRTQRRGKAKAIFEKMSDPKVNAEVRRKLRASLPEIFNSVTMKCFSESRDSILQWSYYADGHHGYCVEFDLPHLWHYKRRAGGEGMIAVLKVVYSEEYPAIDVDADLDAIVSKKVLQAGLCTKAKAWFQEEEWRAIRVDTDRGLQELPPQAIRSVTLGASMDPATKERMLELLSKRENPVDLYECKLAEGRYALEVMRLT